MFLIFLFISQTVFGQKQRMAVLPSSLNYGEKNTLKTLCIDFFRAEPKSGDTYQELINISRKDKDLKKKVRKGYKIEGFEDVRKMKLLDKNGEEVFPTEINQTIIIGQTDEKVDNRYLEFIQSKIESYSKQIIKNKEEFDGERHSELQNEIWEYNILNKLGYLTNKGNIQVDLKNGLAKFQNDWGEGKVNAVVKDLNLIKYLNDFGENAYKPLLINKTSSGDYILFDNASKEILRTSSDSELATFMGKYFEDNETIYTYLKNFESIEKQEAFLSTLRIKQTVKGKKLNIRNLSLEKFDVLHSPKLNHKLSKQISESEIGLIEYKGIDYFSTEFQILSKGEDELLTSFRHSDTEKTNFEAMSTSKEILSNFIRKTNVLFKDFTTNISLNIFFNNFKKELKRTLKIKNEEEFIIHVRNEFEDFRIVKLSGSSEIHLITNSNP